MKKKILILSSLFILFIVVLTPASLINHFMPKQSDITISGIKGSVWSGKISQISALGKTFSDVKFSVSPFALFIAKLSLDLDILKGDIEGDFNLSLGSDYAKNMNLDDANLSLEANIFENYLPIKGVEIGGDLKTANLDIQIENKKPSLVDGQLSWKKAMVSFAGQDWLLGDFVVDVTTEEKSKTITGKLLKSKNKLDLKGKFTLNSKGMFEFVGDISTESEQTLYQAFALFNNGKPAKGRLPIKFRQKVL